MMKIEFYNSLKYTRYRYNKVQYFFNNNIFSLILIYYTRNIFHKKKYVNNFTEVFVFVNCGWS